MPKTGAFLTGKKERDAPTHSLLSARFPSTSPAFFSLIPMLGKRDGGEGIKAILHVWKKKNNNNKGGK